MAMTASRREFLGQAAGAGLALSAGPFASRVLGANERVVAGFIGCGGMGRANLRDFQRAGVDVAAVCDVFEPNLYQAVEMTDNRAKPYKDFRQLLDRKDVDVVVISTPDHWHALPMIQACAAGKDVYVEKPLALTIDEGRRMVDAARRHQRVVQVGTQQRSGTHFQKAVEIVRSGALGSVRFVRVWRYGAANLPEGIGNPPDTDPPPGLDWDMWLGPAPKVPYNRNRFLGNFRWFWDYSGGELTDWGTHLIDVVQWGMGVDAPLTAYAVGGKHYLRDNRETPDNIEVVFEYPGFVATFSHRVLNRTIDGRAYGVQFEGTQGVMFVDRGGYDFRPEPERVGDETVPSSGAAVRGERSAQHLPHVQNFLECVKTRQRPASDVEIGHRSTAACHLGNIALRAGQKITWDAATERITDVAAANAHLKKEYRKPWSLD
jgi:predicted dehydrogenase